MQIVFSGASNDDRLDAIGLTAGDVAVFRASAGSDTMLGSAGNDRFDGGAGADSMFGGGGNDQFFITLDNIPGGARDSIDGGTGTDSLIIALNSSQVTTANKAEFARLADFLGTSGSNPAAHFTSDILHLDMAGIEPARLRIDGILHSLAAVPNASASIAGTAAGAVTEDGSLTTSGQLTISDADAGEAHFQAVNGAALVGTYGSFSFDAATGAWSYALNNAAATVQALTVGQTVTDSLIVRSLDGSASRTISVVIAGAIEPGAANPRSLADIAAGTGGFKIIGENGGDQAGFSVSQIGDLNGDGKAEILIGAPYNDQAGSNAGAAYVVWGGSYGSTINLDAVAAGTGGFKIKGQAAGDNAGFDVQSIGDLNGDGKDEILVGAIGNSQSGSQSGAAYVVWGKGTGTAVDLSDVANGIGGFKILGGSNDYRGGLVGAKLGVSADLNGDGKPEILIGKVFDNQGGQEAGAIYVVDGKASGTQVNLDAVGAGTGGFKVYAENAWDHLGGSAGFTSIGDLNGDGIADLVVNSAENDTGAGERGATYVVWGKADNTAINLDSVAAGTGGYKIYGERAFDYSSLAIGTIADLNGDGKQEVLIGAAYNDGGATDSGAVYVVWGKSTTSAIQLTDVANGTGGFKIVGQALNETVGASVSAVGDLNGDGLADILIGAPGTKQGTVDAGSLYVVWGKSTGTTVNLSNVANGTGGVRLFGEHAADLAGHDVTFVGDLNGDGRQDILVAANQDDTGGTDAGATYVIYAPESWIGMH